MLSAAFNLLLKFIFKQVRFQYYNPCASPCAPHLRRCPAPPAALISLTLLHRFPVTHCASPLQPLLVGAWTERAMW